jgi:hypothetical protein
VFEGGRRAHKSRKKGREYQRGKKNSEFMNERWMAGSASMKEGGKGIHE